MADRSAAQIIIGGCIPSQEALWNLLHAIETDGAGEEWNGAPDDGMAASIEQAVRTGEPLVLTDDQAAGGLFPTIEGWCQEYGLPYHRADDGHYAYSPSNTLYRPDLGDDDVIEFGGTIESGPAIVASVFVREQWEEGNSPAQLLDWYLRRITTPLPPLTLAEGVAPNAEEPEEQEAENQAFDPAKVQITRHRQSVTQQEVTVAYDGRVLWNHAGDDMRLCPDGAYRGHDDAHWIDAARREVMGRVEA